MSTDASTLNMLRELQTVLREQQTLATLYGEQFTAIKGTVEAMQGALAEREKKDEDKHRLFLQEMDSMRIEREALMDILTNLQSSIESLQTSEVALINTTDQLVELANERFMPRREKEAR